METTLATIDPKIAQETIESLLSSLGVSGTVETQIGDEGVNAVIATEDSGMIIGYHGETLESLQLIASLQLYKKVGTFVRVSLEVGDYKKNRTDALERLAQGAKERALAESREIALPSLKSWERRIVHVILQEDPEVMSESIGEGKDRTLVVKPRA